jgi:ACS family hexuronate transporter-like MFS transporter
MGCPLCYKSAPMPASSPAELLSPIRSRWAVAAVATLVMGVSYIDRQTLAAISPTVIKALSISREQYGWVLSAFSFSYLIGAPLAGAVLDRTGARRGLVYAVLVWSLVAAGHALVPSLAVLLGLRVLLGTAEAPSFPGAAQTMKRILPPGERSIGFGLLFTGSSVGAMIAGPLAIRILDATGGWRAAFLGTALLGLLWIPLWMIVTRPPAVRDALATRDAGEYAGAAPSYPALLASGAVGRAVMLVLFTAPSIMFGLNWSSQFLADTFDVTQSAIAHYIWLPPLGFDIGAVAFGAVASRADKRMPAGVRKSHTLLLGCAAALSAAMTAMPLTRDPWIAIGLVSISLAGGGGLFAMLTADMLARVHPSHVSTAGGLAAAAQSLAYVVANPLVGRAVDHTHTYATVLLLLGGVVPPAFVAWSVWPLKGSASLPGPTGV